MRSVIFSAPFALETTLRFARAAARLDGVKLLGVMQEPPTGADRRLFTDVARVDDGLSARELIEAIELLRARHGHPHRIIGVLEPLQVQLALARRHFSVPGTDPDTADLFRDKARMKDRLRAAGLPVARHKLITSDDDAASFEREVGFPMVLKPPAGMGAKSTFRVRSRDELLGAVRGMRASANNPVLAEEFLHGEEGSCDTLLIAGEPRLVSMSLYRPGPLEVIENPWMQWCCLLPRVISGPGFDDVKKLSAAAVKVLGLKSGFTHMEWFRRPSGQLAIGEIAQRPPGAHITRMIGLAYDMDPYRVWARGVVDDAFDGARERQFSVGCAYLRGMGRGRVTAVTGVRETNEAIGSLVVESKLPGTGAPKSDSYEGDGYVIVKARETEHVSRALRTIIENIRVHYA